MMENYREPYFKLFGAVCRTLDELTRVQLACDAMIAQSASSEDETVCEKTDAP